MNNQSTNKNNNPNGASLHGVLGGIISSLAFVFSSLIMLVFVLTSALFTYILSAFFTYILPAFITLIILLNTFLIGGLMGGLDKTYWLVIMAFFCIALAYPVYFLSKLKCMDFYCALIRGGS